MVIIGLRLGRDRRRARRNVRSWLDPPRVLFPFFGLLRLALGLAPCRSGLLLRCLLRRGLLPLHASAILPSRLLLFTLLSFLLLGDSLGVYRGVSPTAGRGVFGIAVAGPVVVGTEGGTEGAEGGIEGICEVECRLEEGEYKHEPDQVAKQGAG